MKYYSDVLHSLFETQDALEKAEIEKKKKDDEKARQQEIADKRKAEDKKHFLELREKYLKISDEYETYFEKLLDSYRPSTIISWASEATDETAESIFDICKPIKATKTARAPENLGEILIRIFEDMQ